MNVPIIAIEEDSAEAGAIVWWSLTGQVDHAKLVDSVVNHGLPEKWAPSLPRLETVAHRAAKDPITSKRHMVRSATGRGDYEFVTETLGDDNKLSWTSNVRVRVVGEGDNKQITVTPLTTADMPLAQQIGEAVEHYRQSLISVDVSTWLLDMVSKHVDAVALRERGGFYFIPAGEPLQMWRTIVSALHMVSAHRCSSIPAMRSDDAVEAILAAITREASMEMDALESWLMERDEFSTKGVNANVRHMEALQKKIARYAELLGVALPELTSRSQTLLGAVTAMQLVKR